MGLTPNKSLTLGRLAIPDEYFPDFFRGCIDGDGSVLVDVDRHHTAKNERYVYSRLYVSLVSASRTFVDWIQSTVQRLTSLHGVIETQQRTGRRPIWLLRYAKRETGQGRAIPPGDALEWCGLSTRRRGEMAYSRRSKRRARKGLGVRLPSPAPTSPVPFLDKLPSALVG